MNITAATLRNIVKFDTDIQSLKRVKEQMKKLRKESIGTVGSISPASASKAVASAKAVANQQMSAMSKVFNQASKVKSGFGTGMVGTPSTKDWAAVTAAQMKQMNSVGKTQSEATRQAKEAALAEKRKLQLKKQAAETTKREINSAMKLRDVAFSISRMEQLSIGQRYKAIAQAKQLASEYRRGNLDLRELNQQMKFLTANTRKAEAQARRLKRETTKTKAAEGRKGGGALLGVGLGGYAAAGAVGGAYAAYSSASSSVDRAKETNKLTKAGADSYEAQALQRLIQTKGIDANLENVFQDLQEKLGELTSQGVMDKKTGKLKGGGELTDTFNDLFLPLGYTLKDIAKMSSGEFVVNLMANGKQLKKSNQELRYYTEQVNDLSRVSGLFANNGDEVIEIIKDMKSKGQMLSDEQLASLTRLREWGIAVSNASQTLGDKFTLALESSIGGSQGVAKAFRDVEPLIQGFGTALGKLTLLISWIVSKIPFLRSQEEIRADSLKTHQENLTKGGIRQWIAEVGRDGMKAYQPYANSLSPQAMIPSASSLQPTPYQASATYQTPKQTINVMPAPVSIQIDGNKLEGVFSLIADNKISSYNDNVLNDINSSYLAK
ncbi:hypothetical protein [Yersinia bercovieri]|uniref:hypothetical protein n=1 Tax=Yersinia bercovieri TaxID=634 RepID=UPI001643E097|nr:hypothetical protein [Yersinia bercovieri]